MQRIPSHPCIVLLLAFALGAGLTACQKDEPAPPASSGGGGGGGTSSASTTPAFTDADGLLVATRVFSTQSTPIGTIDVQIGTAVGAFSNDQFASFVSVGAVSCNGEALTPQGNSSYTHVPGVAAPLGIDLTSSNDVVWDVAGGNGFGAFQRTLQGPFPAVNEITSPTTSDRSVDYTLTTTPGSQADSVVFTLGSLVRTVPGNAGSCTFTAAELGGLPAGPSLMLVAPYSSSSEVIGGKRIYFVKQVSRSASITLQ